MYDTIVIGAGPAGITASVYLKRAGIDVLVFYQPNSELEKAHKIENYYGFENGISGKELLDRGMKQAQNLNIPMIKKEVIGIKYSDDGFEVITANQEYEEKYEAKFLILATGASRSKPKIKGIEDYEGKGVSYCAICDGAFYRGKDVAVLGNGEYAVGEIEELIPLAKKVTMLTDGKKAIETRLESIEIKTNPIQEFRGDTKIREVLFKDGSTQKIDGLFVAQGIASSIDFAKKLGAKIENNYIVVNHKMETTIPNVYACGDCTGGILQVSKAIYEGTAAGLEIIKKMKGQG